MSPRDLACALLVMVVFGFNFPIGKAGLSELPPLLLIGCRFARVGAILIPFVRYPRVRGRDLLILSMLLGSVHFAVMFLGLRHIDSGTAAIAVQLQVPFAALLAAVFLKDTLGWRRALGMAVAFAGVMIVAGAPDLRADPTPLLLVISASLIWAVANVYIRRMAPLDGMSLNAWMSLLAAPQLLAASWLLETGQISALADISWVGLGSIAYMALVVTILGYSIWYRLVQSYDVNQTMPFTLLVPFFGVLGGMVLLGEVLGLRDVLGGVITVAGVAVVVLRRPRVFSPRITGQQS